MAFRILPDDVNYDFVKCRWVALSISLFLVLGSLLLIGIRGVVLGTDFTGGVVIDFELDEVDASAERVRSVLVKAGLSGLSVQSFGQSSREFMVVFRGEVAPGGSGAVEHVKSALAELGKITYKKLDYVGAQVGTEQIVEGVLAVACSLIGMFLYLCFRFKWQFAVGGVLALIHDVVVAMGVVSATGIEFGLPATAAILMIIGYSVNDSVVIYDRVRELTGATKSSGSAEYNATDVVNASINSTLSRTLLTSGTTLLSALPLILLCEGVVRDVGVIAFCGVVTGTYSSIFVSTIPFVRSMRKSSLPKDEKKVSV